MNSAKGELVNFYNRYNLELIGLLFKSDIVSSSIIIHIHGNYGNFYNNKFIWTMSHMYTEHGIDFLSFNLSAHDGMAEGYRNGELDYIGGAVADYNESISDIEASVEFAYGLGYKKIILQGHSIGCDKIIKYIISSEYDKNIEIILLSPVDSYAVQERWLHLHHNGETVEDQIDRLNLMDNSTCWLNADEYGAEGFNKDWIYQIPVTKNALISILSGSAFKYLNLKHEVPFQIKNRTFVFLGMNDGLQIVSQNIFAQFIRRHWEFVTIEDTLASDHDIVGAEEKLVFSILRWINL